MSTGKSLPDIRNDEAMKMMVKAAEAVGVTKEQLVSLALDSGIMMLPEVANQKSLSEEITIEGLGQRMWDSALKLSKEERPGWFDGLAPIQKQALITVLRARGYASESISRNFGISAYSVSRTFNKYAQDLGRPLVTIRLEALAGQLQIATERAQEMAMRNNDPSTYFRIFKDYISILHSTGIVEKAATRIEVEQHVSLGIDERDAHVDALIALREKQRKRLEEIKQAKVELIDEQPLEIEGIELENDY